MPDVNFHCQIIKVVVLILALIYAEMAFFSPASDFSIMPHLVISSLCDCGNAWMHMCRGHFGVILQFCGKLINL